MGLWRWVTTPFTRRWRTTKEAGDALEMRVESLYRRLGKWNVKRNITLRDPYGNLSQIDVVYGVIFKRYIECKNYSKDHIVPLADVAKFKEVLLLNGISPRKGIFITTSTYVPRAEHIGIKLVNGQQLRSLERWAAIRVMTKRFIILCGLVTVVLASGHFDKEFNQAERYLRNEYKHWEKYIKDAISSR
eukprot:TRINITY_DN7836_c0_g1_i1.p1 TRINITY_DN7836_c0_g1~~TRINITY_DN7836_c0_g1_i1.p1  ORF type:complete len:189 (+),score=36.01 TRINITY_DN7836_c0_g1_i1:33-599(+)